MATAKKPAAKKTPGSKTTAKPAVEATAKKAAASNAKAAPKKVAPARPAAKKAPAERPSAVAAANGSDHDALGLPAPRGVTKDGITYTKDFDVKFLKAQRDLLTEARGKLAGQATRLEDEANSLIEDGEMGDVQFDDESGEGDTMVVERERDLALSAQARQTIADIDAALSRIAEGTYGYSEVSGRPIPRERLEAIPWATVLVEEKVGGIGRR
jgi:RNA polymerase-binding transcription factor DksA